MTTIREAMQAALPAGAIDRYPLEFEALASALEEREFIIAETVANVVAGRDLSNLDVEDVLSHAPMAGLMVRPAPEPEPEVDPLTGLAESEVQAWEDDLLGRDTETEPATTSEEDSLEVRVARLEKLALRHLHTL